MNKRKTRTWKIIWVEKHATPIQQEIWFEEHTTIIQTDLDGDAQTALAIFMEATSRPIKSIERVIPVNGENGE